MSYPQPAYRPVRPSSRTPSPMSPSYGMPMPFSPAAPAAVSPVQQPRLPFSPESPRPGSSGSHQSRPRPGLSPSPSPSPYQQYPSRPGSSSSRGAASLHSSYRATGPASPRPEYGRAISSSSRGPQPPFSPGHAYDTQSPLSQATTQVDLHDVALDPHGGSKLGGPPIVPPPPIGVTAPTTHSRFSDASLTNAAAASALFRAPDQGSWPRLAQWTFLPVILILSAAEAVIMGHSLSLYGGRKAGGTIDNTVSTHPVWPPDLSLLPSWLLLAVGFTSLCSSIIIWGLSLQNRLMKPVRRLAGVRVGLAVFFVGAWIAALVVYKLFESGSGGDSLSGYACKHKADKITGASEIGRVCMEQNAGFGLAIASAISEIALIGCFFMRNTMAKKDDPLSEKL